MKRALALTLVAFALVARSAEVRADATPTEPPPAKEERSVEVVLLGGGKDTGSLVDTVRELLGRLGLVVNVHAVNADDDAAKVLRGASVARIIVDLRGTDETVLTVDGREGGPARRKVRRDPSPPVAREELAHAIQSAIEAQLLIDGDRPPPPPVVPPPPPVATVESEGPIAVTFPPPPAPHDTKPPPPTHASWGLDVTPLGGAGLFASEVPPVAVFGGEIGFASRRGLGPSGSIGVRANLPFEAESNSVSAHGSVIALRALGGIEIVRASWIVLGAVGGVGMDVISVDPRSRTLPPNVLGSSSTRVDPILSLAVRVSFPIVSSVALTAMLGGDVDLTARRYVVDVGGTQDVALSPWRVRPTLLLGFTFTPFGSGTFAPRGAQ